MSAINGGDKIRKVIPGQHGRPNTPILYKLGQQHERERIIALLENIKTYPTGWDYDEPFASVVKIIKGDN